jgi:hypothetical protein
MRRRTPQAGDGTARLAVDSSRGDYLCYWYTGTNDGHLAEQTRVATAADAVTWGQTRTTRVRIRTADACTYWAGTAPRPAEFTHQWAEPDVPSAASPAIAHDTGARVGEKSGERDGLGHAGQSPLPDEPIPAASDLEVAGAGRRARGTST